MATKKTGSLKGTDVVLITSVNLAADVGASVLPVANGGNGTGSFTDGQILIGQTAGNTLAKAAMSGGATMTAAGVVSVVTNANLTGPITSLGNATSIASQTGTGTKFVVDTSPTLVTPVLGVAAATSLACPTLTSAAAMTLTPASTNDVIVATSGATASLRISGAAATATTALTFYNAVNSAGNRNWAIAQNQHVYADLHFMQSNAKDGNPISAGTTALCIDPNRNVGVGTASPSARVHAVSTTEQLRLGYDSSNYLSTTVSSSGAVTFDAVGASARFVFSDAVTATSLACPTFTTASGAMTFTPASNASFTIASTEFRSGTFSAEKTLQLPVFANAVAHQKIDLYMTGTQALWGALEVEVADSYSYVLAAGVVRRRFYLGISNTIYTNESRYDDDGGATGDVWAISPLRWDATNSRYYITIVHRDSNGSMPLVRMRFLGTSSAFVDNFQTFTLGSVYTTDTTVYDRPRISFSGNVGIGTTTPTSALSVVGVIKMEASSQRRPALTSSNFGYSANFRTLMLGSSSTTYNTADTGAVTLAFGVDVSANAGGTFTGDGSELLFRNVVHFITPNSGNTNYQKVMTFNDSNVGIGTSSPTSLLTVNQAANTTDGTQATYGFQLSNQGTANITIGSNASFNYIQSWASKPLVVNSQGNNTLLNPTSGNVGIGTTSPTASCHTGASTTARASLCLPHGAAPTTPVNGDIWTTTAGLFIRINGVTNGVGDVVGPASSVTGAASVFSGTTGKLLRASPTVTYYSVSAGAEDKIEFGATFKDFRTATDGATVTFDLDLSDQWQVTFAGNRTLAVSNASIGQVITILRYQDATGSRTPTWWANIAWDNGLAPVDVPTASGWSMTVLACVGLDAYSVPNWKEVCRSTSAPRRGITTATDGATVTFDLRVSPRQKVTLAGNRTLALTSGSYYVGQTFDIKLTQDAFGSRTVTWWSAIKWTGGTIPTLTTTAGKSDWFRFVCTDASGSPKFDILGTSMNLGA